jgi:hypothetical protein
MPVSRLTRATKNRPAIDASRKKSGYRDPVRSAWIYATLLSTACGTGEPASTDPGSSGSASSGDDGTETAATDESESGSGEESTYQSVSAGAYHTCAIRSDGTLSCWGEDYFGQASPPPGS